MNEVAKPIVGRCFRFISLVRGLPAPKAEQIAMHRRSVILLNGRA
jgi:hypothetical protein